MRLLFDQNLSRHLVRMFALEYAESRHVTDVGLDTATDEEIWAYAGEHGFVIVSKDSDFRQLAFLHGPTTEGDLGEARKRVDDRHLQHAAQPPQRDCALVREHGRGTADRPVTAQGCSRCRSHSRSGGTGQD